MRILLIDIDTLRPDHLGCYGYHRATSPNIDALAADGVRFDNVYASDVPCLPSRTALCTGRFGTRNGVVSHGGAAPTCDLAPEGSKRQFMTQLSRTTWAGALLLGRLPHRLVLQLPAAPLGAVVDDRVSGGREPDARLRRRARRRGGARTRSDWLDRRGRTDDWLLPRAPVGPAHAVQRARRLRESVRGRPDPRRGTPRRSAPRTGSCPGPHSAQEPWGFSPDEWGQPPPRHPWNLADRWTT